MSNNPKTLLIVGNGYDLACGYATSYNDFIDSNNFKELIENNSNLCKYIKNKRGIQGWADVEEELYNYSINLTKIKGPNNKEENKLFYCEFLSLRSALQSYITEQNVTRDGKVHNSFIDRL